MSHFGEYIRKKRLEKEMTLRQAAKEIGIVPPYLSRIESGQDKPPAMDKLEKMAQVYGVTQEEILSLAKERSAEFYGEAITSNPALHALFKLAKNLDDEQIVGYIKDICDKKEINAEELIKEIRKLKTKFPRIQKYRQDLFAAEVKPPFFSKKIISKKAHSFLKKHGIIKDDSCQLPVPIEKLIEKEDNLRLRVNDALDKLPNGKPIELGMSHWSSYADDIKEIHVNDALYDDSLTNGRRLRFTLAHELFHCLEHLPLIKGETRLIDAYQKTITFDKKESDVSYFDRWIKKTPKPRQLFTDEDWREWQCDYFAACILMPEESIRKEFFKRIPTGLIETTSDEETKRIALRIATDIVFESGVFEKALYEVYDVSKTAMTIRLLQLGLIRH